MASNEVHEATRNEKASVAHTDDDFHKVDTEEDVEAPVARGVDLEAIPEKYWWSYKFLGSAFSIILLAVSLYINFALPASVLLVINEDLGMQSLDDRLSSHH